MYYVGWVTVSAKIRRDLYERLKKYNVPVSEVIRRALEEEVKKREEEEVRNALKYTQKILKKIPSEEIVAIIRESRGE